MKKANSNFKNLLWTLVSFLTLGFVLIAVLAIGWQFANKEGTNIKDLDTWNILKNLGVDLKGNYTFKDLADAQREYGLSGVSKDSYGLIVSSLFFASLACAGSLTILILGLFTKDTKFVIPGMIVDITLTVLVALSAVLAIAGTAVIFDEVAKKTKDTTFAIKAAAGPTSGLYVLLIAPLPLLALPLTSGNWKKAKSSK